MRFIGAAYRRISGLVRGSLSDDFERWKKQVAHTS